MFKHGHFIGRLETNARRKEKEDGREKGCFRCEVFFAVNSYSTDLIGHIPIDRVNREEKRHADWTSQHILKK